MDKVREGAMERAPWKTFHREQLGNGQGLGPGGQGVLGAEGE